MFPTSSSKSPDHKTGPSPRPTLPIAERPAWTSRFRALTTSAGFPILLSSSISYFAGAFHCGRSNLCSRNLGPRFLGLLGGNLSQIFRNLNCDSPSCLTTFLHIGADGLTSCPKRFYERAVSGGKVKSVLRVFLRCRLARCFRVEDHVQWIDSAQSHKYNPRLHSYHAQTCGYTETVIQTFNSEHGNFLLRILGWYSQSPPQAPSSFCPHERLRRLCVSFTLTAC
ncbi:uncharacterized protein BCR38DRAFT_439498 [Pseudomassariella vexata]|uniref:Uncharacterized protein n=1 Tax=Pseudomassariella vexata TaxID=1141098 RepID=A0A1Y2DTW3_9PEZI|nr:uncharacterized protein BCR38DRAFT_439498 [Pseudomassariella vexata]ORY62687.1 hypothetical protein BCR38DRAFT_439498 [Pseudomassariella vexata]